MLLILLFLCPDVQDRQYAISTLPSLVVCERMESYWKCRVAYLEEVRWRHLHEPKQWDVQLKYAQDATLAWYKARSIRTPPTGISNDYRMVAELMLQYGNPPRLPRP